MSRRKQAKPRPIFAYKEEDGAGCTVEDVFMPAAHTNGHTLDTDTHQEKDEDGMFGEFAPLVMDTGPPDIASHPSGANIRSPSPRSIRLHNTPPTSVHLPRPEPLKANLMAPLLLPVTPSNNDNHQNLTHNHSNRSVPASPAKSASSSFSGSEQPSPATTPNTPSMTDGSNGDNSLLKRGSKILPVSGEDGEKFICPVCNTSLLTLHDLTVHIRSHNTPASGSQSNSCKICGKTLSSQSSLDRHMLVHSGERPFICKVCNMSFTTNGNMHRHYRIHTKEESLKSLGPSASQLQMRRGKAAWRQRVSNFLNQQKLTPPASKPAMAFQAESQKDILKNLPNHSQHSVFGRPAEVAATHFPKTGIKRQLSGSDLDSPWSGAFKRPTLDQSDVETSSPSPRKSSLQSQPIKSEPASVDSQSEEREDREVLHCPACPKTFLCKYGLESHVETHPALASHCSLCNLTFKNPRKLRLHRLIAHTEKPESSLKNKDITKEDSDKPELKIGFNDLTFVDFSVEKFPLIAKHYFEENSRLPSSPYVNFVCKLCTKAFPCESSLILHTYSHSKDKCTQCPICDCDYADVAEFHAHMLKHLSDKAFEGIRPSDHDEKGDEDLMPHRLTKHDFLAMFSLKEEEESADHHKSTTPLTSPKKEPSQPVKPEANLNTDYFAKLGQMFSQGVPPMFQNFPMFRPGYQPTLDDFHKMLQVATNMNVLPSMGPGFLMQGLPTTPASHSKVPLNIPALPSTVAMATMSKPSRSQPAVTGREHGEREITDPRNQSSKGGLSCKYCDATFQDFKSLKSHVRTHQGLAPYQCNLCVYSSADKSSLIRHVRTHSGARPYQCLDCNYAFTTRANCERHLRKKHGKTEKEDIARSVYLNKFALESSTNLEGFHSPDTVCKYCGVDFKYFRSLKNHLRTQQSSRQKPYVCHLCLIAFCTKSNCLRHIQKAHPEISAGQGDKYVQYESYTTDEDNDSMCSDDGIPLYSEDIKGDYPFSGRPSSITPQPPIAHSTPHGGSRHVSPNRLVSPLAHLSPAPSPHTRREADDRSCDTPLDFSIRSSSDGETGHTVGQKKTTETPMDLSVKKTSLNVPIAPKTSRDMSLFQCIFCPTGFSDWTVLDHHLRTAHDTSISDTPAIAAQLAALPMYNTEGKLLLPPKAVAGSGFAMGYNPNKAMMTGRTGKTTQKGKQGSMPTTLQGLQDKLKQKREHVLGGESDLASVSRMINATDPLNFKAFFMPVTAGDVPTPPTATSTTPSSSSSSTTAMKQEKTSTFSKFPNILKRPGVQISVEHCKAIHRELDNLQREGDVDEAALSQVREMALTVKEEVVNSTPPVSTAPSVVTIATYPTPQILDAEDETSEDGSTGGQSTGDKGDAPAKKKRNSYADSPHKLACPYCPRAFPWVSSLTRHLLTHTGQKPFKCPRCPVTFSTKSNRERHLIRKHGVNMLDPLSRQTMDRPYKCPLCVFSSFSTQSNLLKHYRDRHNGANLPDNIADIERMSPSAIRAATMEMEIRAAENPPQADDSSNMAAEEDEEDYENSVCSSEKMDEDSISYTEVEKEDSMSEKSDRTSTVSAPTLAGDLQSMMEGEHSSKLAPHLLMAINQARIKMEPGTDQSEKSQDDGASDRVESPTTMKKNIERIIAEQKAIIEQNAQVELKIQSEIRAQIESQQKADDPSMSPLSMSLDQSMDSPMAYDPNKPFTGSAERIINPERDNYDVDKITECWKCKEMFPSRKVLVRHLKEHNIDLPFKCYLCDASYDLRADCLTHQADAHDSDWKILKDKNKVHDIDQFSVHMDKVVENNCNKLDSGSVLEIPGSGHDDSKMEVISADYMQRKVYCSLCPKRFWSLQDLRRHMRSHTGERPFECDLCQKRFTLKHSMMRHRKKHVGAPPRSFDDEEDSNGCPDLGSKSSKSPSSRGLQYPYSTSFNLGGLGALSGTSSTLLYSQQGLVAARQQLAPGSTPETSSPGPSSRSSSETTPSSSSPSKESKARTLDKTSLAAVKKEFFDCDADMLHNLLGVESSAIEKMLDASDVKTAAKYLGIAEVS